ncbi:MAG: glycosyltransferase family 8 protein [Bacteroidales bacterium]|nr:glycosyltransferase family 8 protein [Bacteroidales bacterium]
MTPFTIVVATDSHYTILLAPLIKSIEDSVTKDQKINVYVIDDHIKSSVKVKLEQSIDKNITTLIFKSVDEIIPKGISLPLDKSTYPLTIYLRLFIPSFIPKEVEKVLYLDVDMIVRHDIAKLFSIDLGENILAAVQDPRILTFDNSWGGVKNHKELGIVGETHYFNSGLLLMDAKKWRDLKIAERTVECINDNQKFVNYPDQYGLNVVLANKWVELDSKWNHFACYDIEDPFLIHFIGRKPIYKTYDNVPSYLTIFNQYLGQTAWRNHKPIGESARYLKKIGNILEKIKKIF